MVFVVLCSTVVPGDSAHPIQILKTWHAVAQRPDTTVHLYFVSLGDRPEAILRSYGLAPHPRLIIRSLVPHWYYRLRDMGTYLSPDKYAIYRWVLWRLRGQVRRLAARDKTVVYTRNENVVNFVHPYLKDLRVPLFLELHWFKYVDRFRKEVAKRARKGMPPWKLSEAKAFLRRMIEREQRVLAKTSGVLCLTGPIRDKVAAWNASAPLTVLPSGVTLPATDTSPAAEDIDILFAGQLYPWKNPDLAVRALAHLPERRLTIVGGNNPRDVKRIQALAHEIGVSGRIDLVGHIPHTQVASYVRRARVCIAPLPRAGYPEARFFTSPLKLFEYGAQSKAVVASDLPSLRDALVHGKNAWLVKPDNARSLAEGIERVLSDDALREQLGAGARKMAEEITFEKRAERIVAFCATSEAP